MRKLMALFVLASCTSSGGNEALTQQSIEAHEAALKTSQQVLKRMDELSTLVQQLDDSTRIIFSDSIQKLRSDWEEWESTIVEVPGHEHDHDHHDHGDHDHDHEPSPDLTPEMVLEIQQDLGVRIKQIGQRVENLAKQLK